MFLPLINFFECVWDKKSLEIVFKADALTIDWLLNYINIFNGLNDHKFILYSLSDVKWPTQLSIMNCSHG